MNGTQPACRGRSSRRFGLIEIAVGSTLLLLLYHAVEYASLTDDAFISFRYARNLSSGHGLVFNPGFERIEGYTNLLWVLVLAGFNLVGLASEAVSHVLTLALTIVLWGLVVWFVYRTTPEAERSWLLVVAPLFLAATRSVAVWSTSGLETRLFEVLVVGGALRLIVEVESRLAGEPRRGMAALLFGLATLTRPDGLLISIAAFAVAGWLLASRGHLDRQAFAAQVGLFAVIVGAHYAFRLIYYQQWFPNTYYAKVDGRTWWVMGFAYLVMFALEYGMYLWVPLLIVAVREHRNRKTLFTPLLFAAIVAAHALYTASIGGDHFEYRPLDLYFPLLFILLYDGARSLARRTVWSVAVFAYIGVMLVGLTALPYQSHKQFIDYMPTGGFPGLSGRSVDSNEFMRPERDPIYSLPGLRSIAKAHLSLLRRTTAHFVGIRQEEQRLFLDTVLEEGPRLKRLVEKGVLPPDTHIAIDCVGAIPYYSDLRVLDVLGLTDAHVAHSEFREGYRMMAHDKRATGRYIRRAGVDLWAVDNVHTLVHATHINFPWYVTRSDERRLPTYVADVGDGYFLVGYLPQGIEHASRRFEKLHFRPLRDREVAISVANQAIDIYRGKLREDPGDDVLRVTLADMLMFTGDAKGAIPLYERAAAKRPDDGRLWHNLSRAYYERRHLHQAIAAMRRALELAEDQGERERIDAYRKALWHYRLQLRQSRNR